ncbi:hypothetical protein ZWY2020_007006 [Hordeum vulgare]|nr:hypothetical protein ZWY2020_007006 [Hordeum vulgare]
MPAPPNAAPSFTTNSAAAAGLRFAEITLPNGDVYSGTLSSQQAPEGTGRYVWAGGSCCVYEGRWRRHEHGHGRTLWPSGAVYEVSTPPDSWMARGPTSPAPPPPPPMSLGLRHHYHPPTRGSGRWTASTATGSRHTPTGTPSRAPGCRARWTAMAGTLGPTATPTSAP